MMERLKAVAHLLKREFNVYRLVLEDQRTPVFSKVVLGLAVGYALLPFDLIPDWIPVIGHIDDVIIVPLLIILALKFTPEEIIQEHRARVLNGEAR